jgi:hypothetical protein
MKRKDHTFLFEADDIAQAAREEAAYHEDRVSHWRERKDKALIRVKETIGAKVTTFPVTGGERVDVVVDYGDQSAWTEFQLATTKEKTHKDAAERFRVDERVYGTQVDKSYELDTDDVKHFRLGGDPREE